MPSVQTDLILAGAGVNIYASTPRTADGGNCVEIPVPAGQSGRLEFRTDDAEGQLFMDSGSHGITTNDLIDLYWDGGLRTGITVGTVAGTTLEIGDGSGDPLPAELTDIVAGVQVAFNAAIDGDSLALLALQLAYSNLSLTAPGRLLLADGDDDTIASLVLAANQPRLYDIAGGGSNPFTGDPITSGLVSNGATDAATLKIIWLTDITP